MHCMRRGPSEVRLPPIMPRQRCCSCRGARKQDHAAARSVDRVEADKVSRCRGEPAICLPCQCGRAVRCARSAPDLSSGAAPRHSRASHQPRTCTKWGGKGGKLPWLVEGLNTHDKVGGFQGDTRGLSGACQGSIQNRNSQMFKNTSLFINRYLLVLMASN